MAYSRIFSTYASSKFKDIIPEKKSLFGIAKKAYSRIAKIAYSRIACSIGLREYAKSLIREGHATRTLRMN